MASKPNRIRRTRVQRRLVFQLVDKLGEGLLALALIGVPLVTAVNLIGEANTQRATGAIVESAGTAEGGSGSADLLRALDGRQGSQDPAADGTAPPEASDDRSASGLSEAQRDRALRVLEQLPKERREALYERHSHQLEARGISPDDIERRLGD